jgi:hypothetical protein
VSDVIEIPREIALQMDVKIERDRLTETRRELRETRFQRDAWQIRAEEAEAKLAAATEAAAVAALTSGEFQTKLVAAQKQLAQVGEYARYYSRVVSKKALFPRDAAPLSFAEWYEKLVQGEQP